MLVLVADDDRAVREALERALQLHGYEVALASDGDTALASVETRTPVADLHELTGRAVVQGLDLEDLEVTRPNLEDIYLSLTAEGGEDAR